MYPLLSLLCIVLPVQALFPGQWDKYIHAPSKRTLSPISVLKTTGTVSTNRQGSYTLKGPNATVTWDFGQEVAGLPTIDYGPVSTCGKAGCAAGLPSLTCVRPCNALGLAYSELEAYAGVQSDHSTFFTIEDGTVFLPIQTSPYTVPAKWARGGFRYLTLSLGSSVAADTKVVIRGVSLHYTAEPDLEEVELRNYTGYFYSSDELLNRIWYAGVYTLQLNLVAANTSVNHDYLLEGTSGWSQDAVVNNLTGADTILTDGAKRDRTPWAGDLEISLRSSLLSRNIDNLLAVRNSLFSMLELQDPTTGYFPWAGSPFGDFLVLVDDAYVSDSYNLWTILGYANYVLVTADAAFANQYWGAITKSIEAASAFVSSRHLFNSTRTNDWGRVGQGGENTEVNALYYGTLTKLIQVSPYITGDQTTLTKSWAATAARLKAAVNNHLYSPAAGLYYDNTTAAGHQLYPQDGNSLAVTFNLTRSTSQSKTITRNLAKRWNVYGAPAPELPGYISPYISGVELMAQFTANGADASQPLRLLRDGWGYILSAFSATTLAEGYAANGSLLYGFYTDSTPFISLAHGWSTGPTYSLLAYVMGLQASPLETAGTGVDWIFAPRAVGARLTHAEGGFVLRTGEYQASWELDDKVFEATLSVPRGTEGTVMVPLFGRDGLEGVELTIDGERVRKAAVSDGFAVVTGVHGGQHEVCLTF